MNDCCVTLIRIASLPHFSLDGSTSASEAISQKCYIFPFFEKKKYLCVCFGSWEDVLARLHRSSLYNFLDIFISHFVPCGTQVTEIGIKQPVLLDFQRQSCLPYASFLCFLFSLKMCFYAEKI